MTRQEAPELGPLYDFMLRMDDIHLHVEKPNGTS